MTRAVRRPPGVPLALALVAALAAFVSLGAWASGALRGVELSAVDARFELRGTQSSPPDLVVVAIDDVTFGELDEQWPFPRKLHARLIDALSRAGARAIAYDVQFTEPTATAQDNALIEAVDRAEGVVLSTTETDGRGRTNVFGGDEVVRRVGARVGNTVLMTDPGGTIRRMPYASGGLSAFAPVTVAVASGRRVGTAGRDDDSYPVDFRGPPRTIETVSFSEVLDGEVPPARLRGKTVVVGATAPSLQDVHPTPFANKLMSGAELQANAIWTVAQGFPLSFAPGWLTLLLIIACAALTPLASLRLRPPAALALAAAAAIAFLAAAQLAFAAGLILTVSYPLLALALGTVGALAAYYLLASLEQQRTRAAFASFVPDAVVDEAIGRAGDDLRLGGERLDATVLFCDLRGFTAFAERRDPAFVVEALNTYLSEMTDAVMDSGGTLVSYMGDGVMAVFGAPVPQDDHADRALAAAREMLGERLARFNRWLDEHAAGTGLEIGIGLFSGPVMSGQVGSRRRVEYAAIGDTTNTAARIEAMTKDLGNTLLIGQTTHDRLRRPPEDLVFAGAHEVRGRAEPIGVWTLSE